MTPIKKDFYGKEVADAIKEACEDFNVPQEQLEIEVVATGSTGIFGLIRKKAHIVASIKDEATSHQQEPKGSAEKDGTEESAGQDTTAQNRPEHDQQIQDTHLEKTVEEQSDDPAEREEVEEIGDEKLKVGEDTEEDEDFDDQEEEIELSEESLKSIESELVQLLTLMGYPSPVTVSAEGTAVLCHIGEEFESELTGQDGKTLDSLQYLIRKIVARKIPQRLRLTVDVGNFREKRLNDLKERAVQLAEKVKENGKTQVIPALSPSERRVIHMSLQDDKEIRSRSVGDGLFKKILIYKPGKGGNKSAGRGGRKRGPSRGKKNYSSRKRNEKNSE